MIDDAFELAREIEAKFDDENTSVERIILSDDEKELTSVYTTDGVQVYFHWAAQVVVDDVSDKFVTDTGIEFYPLDVPTSAEIGWIYQWPKMVKSVGQIHFKWDHAKNDWRAMRVWTDLHMYEENM